MKVYCPDLECDSCVKVLTKTLVNANFRDFKFEKDGVILDQEGDPNHAVKIIQEKGYRAALSPFERKSFSERLRDFKENKKKYEVEYKLLKFTLITFVLLSMFEVIAYYAFFKSVPEFLSKYSWWLLYSALSVVGIAAAVVHVRSYRAEVTHMVGMMIGMTVGMQTGLLVGVILGATNGFFIGALVGMLVAVILGIVNGKCCGIMGVLEGMMAGVMGGTMGGMIGAMMVVDNILIFMPFFMVINLIILLGLSYMLFEEVVEHNVKMQKVPIEFFTFFSYCLIALTLLIIIMVYGPKSGIAGVI
ncbi:MAG: hypothetical protein WC595_02640 [Candidatus Nanoarchaeia archaeon]